MSCHVVSALIQFTFQKTVRLAHPFLLLFFKVPQTACFLLNTEHRTQIYKWYISEVRPRTVIFHHRKKLHRQLSLNQGHWSYETARLPVETMPPFHLYTVRPINIRTFRNLWVLQLSTGVGEGLEKILYVFGIWLMQTSRATSISFIQLSSSGLSPTS